jgi:two-component system LytT family sensor kinase
VVIGLIEGTREIRRRIGYPGVTALLVVWTVVGSLAYTRHYLQDYSVSTVPATKMLFEYLIWLTCFYPWIGLAPLVFRLERGYPLGTVGWARNLGRLMLSALPFVYAGAVVTQVLCVMLQGLFQSSIGVSASWWRPPLREMAVQFALYWTTVGGAYVIRSLIQLQDREQQAARLALEKSQLETSLRQAELETLRARLNPHFLFNCLQNISVLTREDPETASQMLARLGQLLRSALRRGDAPETTLAAEIELTKAYIAVEQIRFADRLTVLFDIPMETEPALIPTLFLQPLVENAVVHGLHGIAGQGVIAIRSALDAGALVITVTDNGIGLPAENPPEMKLGVGLTSTCERLQRMYPQQHSFSMRSLPEGGTEVRVAIPLRTSATRAGVVSREQSEAVAG